MPREARKPVAIVTVVAVVGLLLQVLGAGLWLGKLEATKADLSAVEQLARDLGARATVSQLEAVRNHLDDQHHRAQDEFQEHVTTRAELDGEIVGELRGINRRLDSIENRLP